MKHLKVKIRRIRVEPPRNHLMLPVIKSTNTATEVLQPHLSHQELQQRVKIGWQRLTVQAERINQLSAELEEAMLELKAIANDLNCDKRYIKATKPIKSVCEYLAAVVPCVRHKKSGAFALTTRPVDLFRAEREATQVAQTLRRRAKKRR